MRIPGEPFFGLKASPLDSILGKPHENDAEGQSLPEQVNKPGPKTQADNFLLGGRNSWVGCFEEQWPEIGWDLLCIRNRRTATLQDIRKTFRKLEGRPDCGACSNFTRGSPYETTGPELRKNRVRRVKLSEAVRKLERQCEDQRWKSAEAKAALAQPKVKERAVIREEAQRRKEMLAQVESDLKTAMAEFDAMEKKVAEQEAFWYCSQLLDFLHSRRRAVDPLNLANALAGLPNMGWRQSHARCSTMPYHSLPRFPYAVFGTISKIWSRRRTPFRDDPVEFFRSQLLALPKIERDHTREHLWEAWRDLRLAIEESWTSDFPDGQLPFILTSAFLRKHSRQKLNDDRILDSREKLLPPTVCRDS